MTPQPFPRVAASSLRALPVGIDVGDGAASLTAQLHQLANTLLSSGYGGSGQWGGVASPCGFVWLVCQPWVATLDFEPKGKAVEAVPVIDVSLDIVSQDQRAVHKCHRMAGHAERSAVQGQFSVTACCVDLVLAHAVGAGCLMQGNAGDGVRRSHDSDR